jgi:hypothetical protein
MQLTHTDWTDWAHRMSATASKTAQEVIAKLRRTLQGADEDDVARQAEHYVPADTKELRITVDRERQSGINALPWPLILFMALQSGAGIWWAATTTANLNNLNTTVLYRQDQTDKAVAGIKSDLENRMDTARRELSQKVDLNDAYITTLTNAMSRAGIPVPDRPKLKGD